MEITIQHVDGCPNLGLLVERLAAAGVDPTTVRFVVVSSSEEADSVGFHGSPTVLVDGEDPFADSWLPVGLACRLYRTESGLEGAPSVAQLRAVLGR